ncbi:MAG: hypothetical protein AB7U20_15290 [Planctomycetaceae bacterium]
MFGRHKNPDRFRWVPPPICIVGVLLFYILSSGPLSWLVAKGIVVPDTVLWEVVTYVYLPLDWVAEVSPPFLSFVIWYEELFWNL